MLKGMVVLGVVFLLVACMLAVVFSTMVKTVDRVMGYSPIVIQVNGP